MKISKLTIAALLTMGLVITGCNNKKSESQPSSDSGSSSQPSVVERIRVTPLDRTLVVGESINLDDFVTVVGGDGGEKAFTAEITSGASAVSLEAKRVTAIAEGDFTITVSAGTKTGLFSGSVLSAVRAAFKDYINNFPSHYGVQIQRYSGNEIVDRDGALIIHQEDYFAHYNWSSSAPKVGGYLKSGDGNMYKWSAEDLAGTDFKAIPGPVAPVTNWDLYFVNTPLYFNFNDYHMTDYPESTEQLLAITDAAPAQADLTSYFNCAIDQLTWCGLSYDFEEDIDKIMYVHAEPKAEGGFDFSFELLYTDTNGTESTDDDHRYGLPFRFLIGNDLPVLNYVQAYVDSGEHPEAVNFSQLSDKISALQTAKNYSISYSSYWVNYSTGAVMDWPTALGKYGLVFGAPDETYGKWVENQGFFRSLDETAVVTENGTYHELVEKKYFDDSWEPYAVPVSTTNISGLFTHDGAVYEYSKADGAAEYSKEATTSTTVWGGDFSQQLATGLALDANFVAKSNVHDDVEGTDTITYADSSVAVEFKKILNQTVAGGLFDEGFANMWQAGAQYLGYFDVAATVSADKLTFDCYFVYSSSAPVFFITVEVSAIGSSVLPVSEADIFGA